MKGSITIDKSHGKPWTVSIQLPIEWLRQFPLDMNVVVAGDTLCSQWGEGMLRQSITLHLRQVRKTFASRREAEAYAQQTCGEIHASRRQLTDTYHKEFPVTLTEEPSPTDEQENETHSWLNPKP